MRTKKDSTDTLFTHPFFKFLVKVEKSWFGSANRLYYKFYPSWVSISGMRTNFTSAWTTFSVGPSTGEILVWHG